MKARALLVPGLACLVLLGATCWHRQRPAVLAAVRAPEGLGQRAYGHVAALVGFGARHTGSTGWSQALGYISKTLLEMGLSPKLDRWTDPREGIYFTNITVTLPGSHPDKIVIGCHHDTKCTTGHTDPAHNFHFVGANDSGSGVGLLLELARVLKEQTTRRATVELVFFDGEESLSFKWDLSRALFGSRRYVRQYQQSLLDDPQGPKIRAFMLLDMVGGKDLHLDDDLNSDTELKKIVMRAAQATGHQQWFFANRSKVTDDHLPFLEARIPSIDLIDLETNNHWHKPTDTLDNIAAQSLHLVGEVVLTALPGFEERLFPAERKH